MMQSTAKVPRRRICTTEQERRSRQLDQVAPPDPETASQAYREPDDTADDPAQNLERALETGEENPA